VCYYDFVSQIYVVKTRPHLKNRVRTFENIGPNSYEMISVVVNMILINMMMAIINLSFEEIKNNNEQYKNKFELVSTLTKLFCIVTNEDAK
jgi:hypothetical protein